TDERRIGMRGRRCRLDTQLEAFARRDTRELGPHLLEERRDGEVGRVRANRARFELADIEQRIREVRHGLDRLTLLCNRLDGYRAANRTPERAVQQREHLQRLAKIVARRGEKAALGEIGAVGGLARMLELRLNSLALRHIAD